MKPITYEPCEAVAEPLSEYLAEVVDKVFVLPHNPSFIKGVMVHEMWLATPEGRLHSQLMNRYVLATDVIDARRANAIQTRLQGQGKEPKGRPRQFDPRRRDITLQRKVKLYALDCLIAKALGLSTEDIPKPVHEPMQTFSKPVDLYDALARFELWSGVTLPATAWALYTKPDRLQLAKTRPELPVDGDGAVEMEAYRQARAPRVIELVMADVPSEKAA